MKGWVLLMRFAPPPGFSGGRIVTVAARVYSVAAALRRARNRGDGGPYWIAEATQPAHLTWRSA
jgi:hypothetical protein